MFDKLIEFLIGILDKLLPVYIVMEYDNAVLLRVGKFVRVVKPGIHFKWMFIDSVLTHCVATSLMSLPVQSIRTRDSVELVVKGVVKYKAVDVKPLLLEVYDSTDALSDVSQSIIKKQIHTRTWEECNADDIDNEITKALRKEVKKWGIDIDSVTLTSITQSPSLRIFLSDVISAPNMSS